MEKFVVKPARCFILITSLLAAFSAAGQGYKPSRTIELITHTGPGGGGDVAARFLATALEREKLVPVRVQVVNKPGGSGAVASSYIAERKGDTHTLAYFTSLWIGGPLTSKEARTPFHELTPVVQLIIDPAVIAVKADSPYQSVADFIEAAKKSPGKLKQAGGSIDARDNLYRLLLQRSTGASWTYIPFPAGGERIAAIMGGHADVYIPDTGEVREYLRNGSMRLLAQMAERRMPAHPNVPLLREAGFDVPVVGSMRGIVAPPGVPKEVVEYWEGVFERLSRTETWRKYLEENQIEDGFQKSAQLAQSATAFIAQRREIFKLAGIQTYR
jgi:putative tricarboxylic transport membrane protein